MICAMMLCAGCCGKAHNNFIIEGTIYKAKEGEMVCLSYPVKQGDIWIWQRDTTYIQGERFCFKGCIEDLRAASLTFQDMDYANIYIEPTKMSFRAKRDSLYNFTLQGLSIDSELAEYRAIFGSVERELWEKHHLLQQKNIEWLVANNSGAENSEQLLAKFYALVAEHRAVMNCWTELATEFVQTHPHYAITPYIFEHLLAQDHNISNDIEYHGTMGELLALRREITEAGGATVGCRVLDFTLKRADGETIKLSECYAKGCVLLDFWASWCRPCIAEIPKLQALHNRYKDKLQIVSISVDEDMEQWRNAIKQHNLTEWTQLIVDRTADATSYYFSQQGDIAMAYDVAQIPCFILINTHGVVVARWSHITDDIEPQIIEELEKMAK